jgi:hypothetical protein
MREFTIKLRHDNGKVSITTWADSKEQAIKQVLDAEGAPESAVIAISYPTKSANSGIDWIINRSPW